MAGGHPTQPPNKGPWIRGCWLGLLTNQLYWHTAPSIIPTVRIGFAVDDWGRSPESPSTGVPFGIFFRSIPKKCHRSQARAISDGTPPNSGDTIRYRNARQAVTIHKGHLPDSCDTIRNSVIGFCFACRIGMQHRFLCIEHNPIDLSVIHIPCANLNCLQVAAVNEDPRPNAGNAVRYSDALQTSAATKGTPLDAGDAVRNGDTGQTSAVSEGV